MLRIDIKVLRFSNNIFELFFKFFIQAGYSYKFLLNRLHCDVKTADVD